VEQKPLFGCEPAPRTSFLPSCSAQLSTPPPRRPPSLLKRQLREQIHPTQCSSAFLYPYERAPYVHSLTANGSRGAPNTARYPLSTAAAGGSSSLHHGHYRPCPYRT